MNFYCFKTATVYPFKKMKSLILLWKREKKLSIMFYLFLIILFGGYLRFHNIDKFSLWFDESAVVTDERSIKKVFGSFLKMEDDVYTFAYYSIIYFWKHLIGYSEIKLRMLSAITSIASILAIFYLGKSLFNKKVGLFSSFLLAVSPLNIYYAQEVRMYSLLSLMTIMAVYLLKKFLENEKYIFLIGYVILNTVSIYIHYAAILILFGEIFFFLFYLRKYKHLVKKWLICHLIILLILAPFFIGILVRLRFMFCKERIYWVPSYLLSVSLKNIFFTFKNFTLGYNASALVYYPGTLLFFLFFILGVIKKENKEGLTMSLSCLFVPIFIMFLISKFKVIYVDRHLIMSSIFYYIIVANGLSLVKNKYIALIVTFTIIFLSSFALKNYYMNYLPYSLPQHVGVFLKKDHKAAANYVAENFQKGDAVFHTCESTVYSFNYYFNYIYGNKSHLLNGAGVKENDGIVLSLTDSNELSGFNYSIPNNFINNDIINRAIHVSLENYKRIWLIFSWWDFDESNNPGSPSMRLVNWLDEKYTRIKRDEFTGIVVYLYIKPLPTKLAKIKG